MEESKRNKMADAPMKKLFWKMGLPMIVSMVLQALYNVVDSIFNSIYDLLKESFSNKTKAKKVCPELVNDFEIWVENYWNLERPSNNKNDIIFNIENEKDYYKAIIYYISGMTDNYAINMYNRIIKF